LLVGLSEVNVLAVEDEIDVPLRVHVETTVGLVGCTSCGTRARVKDRHPVALVDLAAFGRPAVLVCHKRRWSCPDVACDMGTFMEIDARIAAPRAKVTDRAGRWVTAQVVRDGRSVAEVARELGCDWHAVMNAVTAYGTPLIEHDAHSSTSRTAAVASAPSWPATSRASSSNRASPRSSMAIVPSSSSERMCQTGRSCASAIVAASMKESWAL
jgi:hypothetical protein